MSPHPCQGTVSAPPLFLPPNLALLTVAARQTHLCTILPNDTKGMTLADRCHPTGLCTLLRPTCVQTGRCDHLAVASCLHCRICRAHLRLLRKAWSCQAIFKVLGSIRVLEGCRLRQDILEGEATVTGRNNHPDSWFAALKSCRMFCLRWELCTKLKRLLVSGL